MRIHYSPGQYAAEAVHLFGRWLVYALLGRMLPPQALKTEDQP